MSTNLKPGDVMPTQTQVFEQVDLIRYAGASGDFNQLHWNSDFALTASPTKGVIVHGMLSLAVLVRVVGDWVGGDDRVISTSVSMRAPCPVGSTVTFSATVLDTDEQAGSATLQVSAELPDGAPLIDPKRSRMTVRLSD